MKYMITGAEVRGESDSLDAEEIGRRVTHHQQKLDGLLRARVRGGKPGLMFVSVGLGRDRETITVKNRGGEHLRIDGPFPETKELVGGFDIIDFDSEQEAIAFARYEEAHQSLVTEVRPIREFWWISQTFGQAASKIFMLTSVENERAALSISRERAHEDNAAASGRRRGIRGEPRDARSGTRTVGRRALAGFRAGENDTMEKRRARS